MFCVERIYILNLKLANLLPLDFGLVSRKPLEIQG
jgi:hypothetical protein